jgi:UPF0716 protein FxsA
MFLVLALVFVVVPLVEIYVLVQVGQEIGALNTIGLLILVSIVGAWLARHEGFVVLQRFRLRLDRGELPGKELLDGVIIFSAAVLLVTPGFVTDVAGILLLFPPTRAVVRAFLSRRLRMQVLGGTPGRSGPGPGPGASRGPDDVIDL